jgi:lysozyme family protein
MADFPLAFAFVMSHEDSALEFDVQGNLIEPISPRAGRVTKDSGGETRFGIAKRFHLLLPDSFYTLPVEGALAIARSLIQNEYWKALHGDELKDQAVASKVLDMAVDMGVEQATKYAQQCAAIKDDGRFGSLTLKSINAGSPMVLLERLVQISKAHYYKVVEKHPADAPDLNGWLKRAEDVPRFATVAEGAGA